MRVGHANLWSTAEENSVKSILLRETRPPPHTHIDTQTQQETIKFNAESHRNDKANV